LLDFDVTTISTIAAAIGVIIGIVLAIEQLRHIARQREADFLIKMNVGFSMTGERGLENMITVMGCQFKDYDDFNAKFGPLYISNNPVSMAFVGLGLYFEGVGVLLHRGLVDADDIYDFQGGAVILTWEKFKPLAEGLRKQLDSDEYYVFFEYLRNEMVRMQKKAKPIKFKAAS
jgi:hypothetical protein